MKIHLDHEDRAGFITPRIRVFLSVDLIGSTEFKIRSASDKNWPSVLMGFYSDFQNKFFENWDQWKALYKATPLQLPRGPGPRLWKALGDELIFWKECHSEHEVSGIVQVWRKTLLDFKASWTHPELRFKSGAWLVGSPVRNWEVAFLKDSPIEDDTPYLGNGTAYNFHLLSHYYDPENQRRIDIDFIGPSMDCGFRLLKFVDEEKLILSADLAYLIALSNGWWNQHFKNSSYPKIEFFLDESQPLNGVTGGLLDYPIIWLRALGDGDKTFERDHVGFVRKHLGTEPRAVSATQLQDFLDTYLGEITGFPEKPYICRRENSGIEITSGAIADGHKEKIVEFRGIYLAAVKQDADIIESLQSDGEGISKTEEEIQNSVKIVTDSLPDGE